MDNADTAPGRRLAAAGFRGQVGSDWPSGDVSKLKRQDRKMSDRADVTATQPLQRSAMMRTDRLSAVGAHYCLACEVGMEAALRRLDALEQSRLRAPIALVDCLIRAAGLSLAHHPLNERPPENTIGDDAEAATSVLVPLDEMTEDRVVLDPATKSLFEIAAGMPEGAVSSATLRLCGLGARRANAVDINARLPYPTLAVGSIRESVLQDEDGNVLPAKVMEAILFVDRRVTDEATAAAFLGHLKHLLEDSDAIFEPGPLDQVCGSA